MGKSTYDAVANAFYLALRQVNNGEAVEQVVVERAAGEVILDFNATGELLGVEVIGARELLAESVLAEVNEL